jgi:AAHS family 4-hydroxybenzoate transporter-like MFS transporter
VLTYPSMMRATGVGWAMAFGRMGQVIGPLVIAALLAGGFAPDRIFLWCVAPALCAAGAIALLRSLGPDLTDGSQPAANKPQQRGASK